MPPWLRSNLSFAALAAACSLAAAACGLDEGERFGRAGASPGVLRLHVLDAPDELDPARASTAVERGLARELFAALVEVERGQVVPSLAVGWQVRAGGLTFSLRKDARFTDGEPVTAEDVVWSWQRALRSSTAAVDLRPLEVIRGGRELARGTLLRVGASGGRARSAPWASYGQAPRVATATTAVAFGRGASVHVVDTNVRVPCCGAAVPLRTAPDDVAPARGALDVGENAVIIASRHVETGRDVTYVQLRATSGLAGWARLDEVAMHVPRLGVVHVVDRDGNGAALRAGPDDDAPIRAALADDDSIEVLDRGESFLFVADVRSGRVGYVSRATVDESARERRWYLVEDPSGMRGWLPDEELVFDPGTLGVRAADELTVEVDLDSSVPTERALQAMAEPVMRPVPGRVVQAWGRDWIAPERIATSGAFHLGSRSAAGIVLVRSTTSFLAPRARLDRVVMTENARRTSALHLYRAGLVDALFDGSLPPDLLTTLSVASDYQSGPNGGGLVAPEVRGFSPVPLTLRDVEVVSP